MKTLYECVTNVADRLDDTRTPVSTTVWAWSELELYVKDGYDAMARRTKCLFDMYYPENIATCGNYVARWELEYVEPEQVVFGLINFTGGYWERDYAEASARGPVNHTAPWEADYLTTTFAVSEHDIPRDMIEADRVTYDWRTLVPTYSQQLEDIEGRYETTQGDAFRYTMDKDGLHVMRIVPAGNAGATVYEYSGTFGILRDADDSEWDGAAIFGTYGTPREIPEHFPIGAQYGIPRRMYSDDANIRMEIIRKGRDLDQYGFEIPDRFVKYVEFWACAQALERDGPGQDLKLSRHFMERFDEGTMRLFRRMSEVRKERPGRLGRGGRVFGGPPLARLPWRYGRQIRRA